jgi:nitroreductase
MSEICAILELARYAPSGDNTQPWRFAIEGERAVTVYGRDTRDTCVYDLDGRASQISIGALLETIAIAATRYRLSTSAARRKDTPKQAPVFDVAFGETPAIEADPLAAFIVERRVCRRPLSTRPLTPAEREALAVAAAPYELRWFDGWQGRRRMAALNFRNAGLRLTMREAYEVHRDVIAWGTTQSEDRIPDAALGASPLSLMMMRSAMKSWRRIDFLNRYLAGTFAPRIEMDWIPGLACAAHVVLVAREPPAGIDDYVAAGRAVQRFWLTAARLGLQFQPSYTPLVFSRFVREGTRFCASADAHERAVGIRAALGDLLGPDVADRAAFMGRIGAGKPAAARSTRLPLARLLRQPDSMPVP